MAAIKWIVQTVTLEAVARQGLWHLLDQETNEAAAQVDGGGGPTVLQGQIWNPILSEQRYRDGKASTQETNDKMPEKDKD